MRVAVILTGELRNIDFCLSWWNNVIEKCDHDVTLYSSTWSHLNNSCINSKNKQQIENTSIDSNSVPVALQMHYPGPKYHICNDNKLKDLEISTNLSRYLNSQYNHGLSYYLGRVLHLSEAINIWYGDLIHFDIIIHARWDSAFRNTNFFNYVCNRAKDDIVFRGLKVDMGLLYSCDWAYAGPADQLITLYHDCLDKHVGIYEYYLAKNPTVANTFLIGHNIHSTYIMHQLKSIQSIDFDCTLVRNHNLPFEYNEETWQALNKIFIDTTTPSPVDKF